MLAQAQAKVKQNHGLVSQVVRTLLPFLSPHDSRQAGLICTRQRSSPVHHGEI
jgi:hypothetical protein